MWRFWFWVVVFRVVMVGGFGVGVRVSWVWLFCLNRILAVVGGYGMVNVNPSSGLFPPKRVVLSVSPVVEMVCMV